VDAVTAEATPHVPTRRRRFGLRTRAAAAMALGGLAVSLTLGFLAYSLSRAYLLDKRIDLVRQEAMLQARIVAGPAASEPSPPSALLQGLGSTDRPVLLRSGDQWFGSVVGIGRRAVPAELAERVDEGTAAVAFTRIGGDPVAVVGIPLPGADRALYQFIPLVELAATLAAIRNALVVAAAVTTAGSAAYGLVMSGRVLRPLGETASAARRIAGGDMAARLDDHGDPDLVPLVESFNDMAAALDARIERERRFAADVSHELRTPLTALAAAVRIVERRSDGLDPSGREAVEVLRGQTDQFTRLVLEILDLSRLEAGIADVQSELVDLRAAVGAMAAEAGLDPHRIRISGDTPERVVVDPRRLRVTVRNLLENADRYGRGCTALTVDSDGSTWTLTVDDAGPGVRPEERQRIFERFHRGSAGSSAQAPRGTGLGLSLVAENVRAMGGTVTVTDAPGGGARFVVQLPIGDGTCDRSDDGSENRAESGSVNGATPAPRRERTTPGTV
jgi:signal transduction histidine kinase